MAPSNLHSPPSRDLDDPSPRHRAGPEPRYDPVNVTVWVSLVVLLVAFWTGVVVLLVAVV